MAGSSSPRSASHPKQVKTRDDNISQPRKKKKNHHPKKPSEDSKSNQSLQSSLQNVDKSNSKTNSKVQDNSRLLEANSSTRVAEKKSSPVKISESNDMESANLVANISLVAINPKPIEEKVNSAWIEVPRKRGGGRGRGNPTVGVAGFEGGGHGRVCTPERPVGGLQEHAVKPIVASVKQQHEDVKKQPQITTPAVEIFTENQQFTADEETERVKIAHTTSKNEISVKKQKPVAGPLVQTTLKYKATVEKVSIEFEKSTVECEKSTAECVKSTAECEKLTVKFEKSTVELENSNTEEGVQNKKESKNAPKDKSLREDDRQGGARPKSSQHLPPGSGNLKGSSSEDSRAKTSRLQGQNQQRWRENRLSVEGSVSQEYYREEKTFNYKEDGSSQYHDFYQRGRGRGQRGRGGGQWERGGQRGRGAGQRGRGGPRIDVPLRLADQLPNFIQEVKDDLFNCNAVCSLAHCVSSDFRMGQGVAVEFKKRFHGVNELLLQNKGPGEVAFLRRQERYVYYLVTKKEFHNKPTIGSLEKSLIDLKTLVEEHKVTNLAMPRIGSGLDRLDWDVVLNSIIKIFHEGNVQITVYVHNPKANRH